jgi:hypothetical protein
VWPSLGGWGCYRLVSEHFVSDGSNKTHPGWPRMIYIGIRTIGSTLDLYGPETNMKFPCALSIGATRCKVYCAWNNTGAQYRVVMCTTY